MKQSINIITQRIYICYTILEYLRYKKLSALGNEYYAKPIRCNLVLWQSGAITADPNTAVAPFTYMD